MCMVLILALALILGGPKMDIRTKLQPHEHSRHVSCQVLVSQADAASMIQQASNGHRLVFACERRMALYTDAPPHTPPGWVSDVFGIYTY